MTYKRVEVRCFGRDQVASGCFSRVKLALIVAVARVYRASNDGTLSGGPHGNYSARRFPR